MPIASNQSAESILADARGALSDAKRFAAKLRAAENSGKSKLPGGYDDFVRRLTVDVQAATEALESREEPRQASSSPSDVTLKQRCGVLFNALASIRNDVAKRRPSGDALARAVGVGQPLDRHSVAALLEAAGATLASLDDPALRKSAVDAGVTTVRAQALTALRDALAHAQSTAGAPPASSAPGKRSARLFASLAKLVAQWSAVASRVVTSGASPSEHAKSGGAERKSESPPPRRAKRSASAPRSRARSRTATGSKHPTARSG